MVHEPRARQHKDEGQSTLFLLRVLYSLTCDFRCLPFRGTVGGCCSIDMWKTGLRDLQVGDHLRHLLYGGRVIVRTV